MKSDIFSCEKRIIDLNSKDAFSIETFMNEHMLELSKCDYDEKKQIIHNAPMIALDQVSRNGSMYDGKMIVESLQAPYVAELFHRGTFFSELEHPPMDCSRERFMTVMKDNVCGRFMNWKRNPSDNTIYGNYQFVQPKGYVPKDWLEKGINFGWSIRTLTPTYEERKDAKGNPYVYKFGTCRTVAVDTVSITGFKQCSFVSDVDSYDASKESFNNIKLCWTKKRSKEEFKRLLSSQESLPLMEDIYGFNFADVDDISYSNEGLITIVTKRTKNYTQAVKIPANVYKINQILGIK